MTTYVEAQPKVIGRTSNGGLLSTFTMMLGLTLVATLPFQANLEIGANPDPLAGTPLSLPDLVMMVVGVLGFFGLLWRCFFPNKNPLSWALKALLGFWLTVAVSFAFHPSARGFMQVARLAAVPVLVGLAGSQPNFRRLMRVFVAATSISAILTITQRIIGRDVGLGFLGERSVPFLSLVPGYPTPTGLTGHPYHAGILHLAGLVTILVLAGRRIEPLQRAIPITLLLAFATVQASSRMLLVSVVVALGVLLATLIVHSKDRAIHAALFITVVIALGGWFGTHAESFSRVGADTERKGQLVSTSGNGRAELVTQSIEIWKSSPIIGVGPGNYVRAQRDLELAQLGPWPIAVHSFPLQVLSETGLAGVAALAAVLGVLLARLRKPRLSGLLALAPLIPVALLDHAMWSYGFGLAVLAVAISLASLKTSELGLSIEG